MAERPVGQRRPRGSGGQGVEAEGAGPGARGRGLRRGGARWQRGRPVRCRPVPSRPSRRRHGPHGLRHLLPHLRQEADADPDGGAGRRRQDHHPLQAEAGGDRHHHPHHRVQRGDGGVQEHLLHRLGRGRPGQDPTPLEALLPKHAGSDLRGGQQRPRAGAGVCRGAAEDAAGGRAAGRRLAGVRQQAGHAQRHGGERADRQAGAADAAQQDLVRAGHVRDAGHGALRRAGLALARALQALAGPAARGPDEPGTSLPTAVSFGFPWFIWGGGGLCFSFLPRAALPPVGLEPRGLFGQLRFPVPCLRPRGAACRPPSPPACVVCHSLPGSAEVARPRASLPAWHVPERHVPKCPCRGGTSLSVPAGVTRPRASLLGWHVPECPCWGDTSPSVPPGVARPQVSLLG